MPVDPGPAKDLIQSQTARLSRQWTPQAQQEEEPHEAMNVGMLSESRPVEPTDVIVLAIGVVVPRAVYAGLRRP